MSKLEELKCPNCGAPIPFGRQVECGYCGSRFTIKALPQGRKVSDDFTPRSYGNTAYWSIYDEENRRVL